MEIKFVNTIEEIHLATKHMYYKFGYNKFKDLACLYLFISGIYSSIKENDISILIIYIIAACITYIIFKKIEDKDIEKFSKKDAIKKCKKHKYYLSEKKIVLDNKSIFVYWMENNIEKSFEIKLNSFVKFEVLDKYILIFPLGKLGYKGQLIIPNKAFKTEEDFNIFVEKIRILTFNMKSKYKIKK